MKSFDDDCEKTHKNSDTTHKNLNKYLRGTTTENSITDAERALDQHTQHTRTTRCFPTPLPPSCPHTHGGGRCYPPPRRGRPAPHPAPAVALKGHPPPTRPKGRHRCYPPPRRGRPEAYPPHTGAAHPGPPTPPRNPRGPPYKDRVRFDSSGVPR